MSNTVALAPIADSALLVGDPGYKSISIPQWTSFFNKRARQLCTRMNLVKRRALFSTEAGNEIYTYPKNMVQMVSLEFTTSPTDRTTFRKLSEMFRDEFEAATTNQYPSGDPSAYYADQGWFYLHPMPAAVYTNGGRITYWGLPDAVLRPDVETLPFADSARDLLHEGLLADGYNIMEKYDKADRQEQKFEGLIARTADTLQDRSDDRRPSLRPRTRTRGYGGQV